MFWNVTGEICLYNFSSVETLASKDVLELIVFVFSPDVDSKTFKNIEILQAHRPPRYMDSTSIHCQNTSQIHFDVSSNNFALTL